MPSWSDLLDELEQVEPDEKSAFVADKARETTQKIAGLCDRNVLYYASGFLQKPHIPGLYISINMEDINGFMAGVHDLDFNKDLLLILHTPGGLAEAAQTIVDYLRSKFKAIDVLVPTFAMSAGTMIALGCNRIIMGRQSQLGPTDPQLLVGNRSFSAHSIVEQFEEAKQDIAGNPVLAHAWAPVLRSFGPALIQEARKSISYGQSLVEEWLQKYMFAGQDNSAELAKSVAEYFSGNEHGSHGKRINRETARAHHLKVIDLEEDQDLQEASLTLYHLSTIAFDQGTAAKSVISSNNRLWVKNLNFSAPPPTTP